MSSRKTTTGGRHNVRRGGLTRAELRTMPHGSPATHLIGEHVIEHSTDRLTDVAEGDPCVENYHERHGTQTMQVLTVQRPSQAVRVVSAFAPLIAGKVVVEVGCGVGLVALEMARHAAHVYAVDLDPVWTYTFLEHVYAVKPANLTFIFGRAQDVLPPAVMQLRADVAVCFTRSDGESLRALCEQFAPEVIWGADYLYLIK